MSPRVSIVVSVLDEAANILPVCAEIASTLPHLPGSEVIFVDDGSRDETVANLLNIRANLIPGLRIIRHERCLGKSAALRTGITAAQGKWIATMDGDGQDDPATILTMFNAIKDTRDIISPLVVGIRRKRHDTLSRRVATRCANAIRKRLLNDGCDDTGAPMKLFARDLFLRLPQFEGLHRFLPALFKTYGSRLICVETPHRARINGKSKYTNYQRALVGIRDLIGVMWLQQRTHLSHDTREL